MRVAFLVLNHRPPEQLLRLLATLRHQLPDSALVVHHDRFHTALEADVFRPIGPVHLLTSDFPIRWGDFSLLDCTWRCLHWINENIQFDWLVLLSAQDYPIKPLSGLANYLAGSGADALLTASPIEELASSSRSRDMRRRYLYQYGTATTSRLAPQGHDRLWRALRYSVGTPVDALNYVQPYFKVYKFPDAMPWRLGWRARITPFSAAGPCWFGSAWYCVSRKATVYLDQFVQQNSSFIDYYRGTVYPDESATATILNNASELVVKPCVTHYTKWSDPKSGHPDILSMDDLPDIVQSSSYFARKFDLGYDSRVLNRLDELCSSPPELPERSAAGS